MRNFLSNLVATFFTGPRYFPEFQWSDKLWTHNVFRFFGHFFGEIYTMRPSVAGWRNNYYKTHFVATAYTLEGVCALMEAAIRAYLTRNFAFKVVLLPQLQMAGMHKNGFSPYRFALAFNAATTGSANSTSVTYAHTISGSNTLLWVSAGLNLAAPSDPLTGITYNSAALSLGVKQVTGTLVNPTYLYYKVSPTTGSNNVVVSVSPAGAIDSVAVSYTGAAQTGVVDSSNGSYQNVNDTASLSTTVILPNCWIIAACEEANQGSPVPTAPYTRRSTETFECVTADSNGTVSTGSNTVTYSVTGGRFWTIIMVSFPPFTTSAVNSGFLFAASR